MSVFVHAHGIKTVHAGGRGGSKNGKILSTELLNAPLYIKSRLWGCYRLRYVTKRDVLLLPTLRYSGVTILFYQYHGKYLILCNGGLLCKYILIGKYAANQIDPPCSQIPCFQIVQGAAARELCFTSAKLAALRAACRLGVRPHTRARGGNSRAEFRNDDSLSFQSSLRARL